MKFLDNNSVRSLSVAGWCSFVTALSQCSALSGLYLPEHDAIILNNDGWDAFISAAAKSADNQDAFYKVQIALIEGVSQQYPPLAKTLKLMSFVVTFNIDDYYQNMPSIGKLLNVNNLSCA